MFQYHILLAVPSYPALFSLPFGFIVQSLFHYNVNH